MRDTLRYTLSPPVSTVIVGCNYIAQLEENVQIAREFTPLSQPRWPPSAIRSPPWQDNPSSSTSKPAPGIPTHRTAGKTTMEQSSDWEWLKFLRLLDAPVVPCINVILHDAPRQESHESPER
jgi:hypothetical protein